MSILPPAITVFRALRLVRSEFLLGSLKRTPTIRRPPQNELLSAPSFVFLKNKGYAPEPLRLIEDQPNCLNPRRCCPPAWCIFQPESQLDRKVLVFRRDLDYGCTLYI